MRTVRVSVLTVRSSVLTVRSSVLTVRLSLRVLTVDSKIRCLCVLSAWTARLTTLTVSNEFERVNVRLRVSMCVCGVGQCV